MREILFRGKRVDNGEWVYGSLIRMDDGGHQTFIFPPYNKASSRSCGQLVAWGMIAVIPETVGQDTGLKDKKGKKIFEGDIVINQYDVKGYIAFLQQGMGYLIVYEHHDSRIGHRSRGSSYHMDYGLEIIGNIHENPELVED